jgi:hypothetical protein
MDSEGFPGWMTEVKIPLAALGIDGSTDDQLIGFELQQDESDDVSVGRASMSKWWSASNNSWANAGIWGTAILSHRSVDTVFEISRVPNGSITVDGVMDNIYKKVNPVTMNLFRVGDPPTAESPVVDSDPMFGSFITTYPCYDNDNMYVFMDVVDQVVVDIPANPTYNQDAVEIYFDGTNDHTTETSLKSGVQWQFTIPHWVMGQEVGHIGTCFGTVVDTTGIVYKMVDHDLVGNNKSITEEGSGYYLEVKIPLAALGMYVNVPFGFELQKDNSNDASVGRGGMEKWWNASNNSWANAGIWGYAKLFYPGDGVATKINNQPDQFALNQNYPNPFNPSTTIQYGLPARSTVRLVIYNVLGQIVKDLINTEQQAGIQSLVWNANVASGIYFYRLEATSLDNPSKRFVETKKMLLLK